MPRLSTQQTNFTAGEISPRVVGRTDIDRYANAARKLINAHAVIHGGAKRRGGTLYVAGTKFNAKRSRLVPFVFSRDAAYMLEVGDNYLRVFGAGGVNFATEVATAYLESMIAEIDYVQGADTMFMSHPSAPIQRLRRFSNTSWDLSATPFTTTPFDEQGHALAANVTLSAATVGTGRTATASAAVYLPSDVGRTLVSGSGLATVTGYTDTTHLTVDITVAFAGAALASGAWRLDISPQAILKPQAKDPVASSIYLRSALTRAATINLTAKTGAITINATAGIFAPADTGKVLYADSGEVTLTYVSATQCTGTTTSDFASFSYATGGYGITGNAWRTEDVGKYVRINGGIAKITAWVNAFEVTATILTALASTIASPPLAWSLEASVWSVANGYPRTVSLHEQRLIAAGTAQYPQTLWGSRIGEYFDFTKGSNDDDSYSFTIASDQINPISYVASLRNLVVYTYGGEFSLRGGIEKPITPTNVQIKPESPHGTKGVRPVLVGKESLSVQRSGRKVRAMSYDYSGDGYRSPDLSVLAEHITAGGITDMAYQQEPDLLLWAVRGDGALLSCTIDREQSVIAWAQHFTDGAVESVATIPNGDRDETWLIVRRVINGATVRYIEIIDDTFEPALPVAVDPNDFPPVAEAAVYGTTVDCGVIVDNSVGQTVFTGLSHLEGKEVDIVADGSVMPRATVTGGLVTLSRLSYRTLIGLPFRSEIGLLTPETGTGTGTAQGNSMRTAEITLRFLDTIGAEVYDGDDRLIGELSFRRFGPEILDKPPALFTGLKRIEALGWERGRSELTIVQAQPLPMHLLSAIRKFTVND